MFLQCACVCQTIYGEQALTFSQTERLENQQSAEKGQLKTDPNGTLTHTHTHTHTVSELSHRQWSQEGKLGKNSDLRTGGWLHSGSGGWMCQIGDSGKETDLDTYGESQFKPGQVLTTSHTDWLTDWLANWITDRLADQLSGWLTDWLTNRLTGWLTNWPTDWLAGWPTDWLTDWLTGWLASLMA
jgi:hypothetical protein